MTQYCAIAKLHGIAECCTCFSLNNVYHGQALHVGLTLLFMQHYHCCVQEETLKTHQCPVESPLLDGHLSLIVELLSFRTTSERYKIGGHPDGDQLIKVRQLCTHLCLVLLVSCVYLMYRSWCWTSCFQRQDLSKKPRTIPVSEKERLNTCYSTRVNIIFDICSVVAASMIF